MAKPKKPRLTARIVRGLDAVYALADVNCYEESDLFKGADTEEERQEVMDAVSWLGNLLNWYEKTHPREDSP